MITVGHDGPKGNIEDGAEGCSEVGSGLGVGFEEDAEKAVDESYGWEYGGAECRTGGYEGDSDGEGWFVVYLICDCFASTEAAAIVGCVGGESFGISFDGRM